MNASGTFSKQEARVAWAVRKRVPKCSLLRSEKPLIVVGVSALKVSTHRVTSSVVSLNPKTNKREKLKAFLLKKSQPNWPKGGRLAFLLDQKVTQCRSETFHPSPDADGVKSLGLVPWVIKSRVFCRMARGTHTNQSASLQMHMGIQWNTCCVCISHSVCLGQSGWIAFLLWHQKTYCPHPLFVGGRYRDRSYPGPMSRGHRRLLLTHCVMQDAGCMGTRILDKIPYKNQSRCVLVCCCWMGHVFRCLSDGCGPVEEDFSRFPFVEHCVPKCRLAT